MEKMSNDLQNTSTQFVRDESMSKSETKFCKDCGTHRPVEAFYKSRNKLSSYCKPHLQKRLQESMFRKFQGIKLNTKWPENGKWPKMQGCGERAQCQVCKEVMSLDFFNFQGRMRRDGSRKPHGFCDFCQKKKLKKRYSVVAHKQRKQSRIA